MPLPDGLLVSNKSLAEEAGDLGLTSTHSMTCEVREQGDGYLRQQLRDDHLVAQLLVFEDAPEGTFGFDECNDLDMFFKELK